MIRFLWSSSVWTCAVLALALSARPACAEHASIDLQVFRVDPDTGQVKAESSASADEEPPPGGVRPRPLFKVQVNDPLVFQVYFTNVYPHKEIKDVTVRYFVVRTDKPGQKNVPDLKNAVLQGRFQLNFKPQARVGARVRFTVKEPGTYLLRIQSENTQSDHEHFSAIDLAVSQ